MKKGRRNLSDKNIQKWCDALNLTGKQRKDFIFAMELERCPSLIKEYVLKMKK